MSGRQLIAAAVCGVAAIGGLVYWDRAADRDIREECATREKVAEAHKEGTVSFLLAYKTRLERAESRLDALESERGR